MTKLVTVCWSTTVQVEVPDEMGTDELNELVGEGADVAARAVAFGWDNVQKSDGVVTDVQVEDSDLHTEK